MALRTAGDTAFAFDRATGRSYELNDTGFSILGALTHASTVTDVVDELGRGSDASKVKGHVERYIRQLVAAGLVGTH